MLSLNSIRTAHLRIGRQLKKFTRVAAVTDGSATLERRHIYILPTRAGLVYALLLLILLVGSINYSLSLGYLLTFLLAGMGIAAMLNTWRNVAGLALRPLRTAPVFAGQAARFAIAVADTTNHSHYAVILRQDRGHAACTDVGAQGCSQTELAVDTRRRGWLPLERLTIQSIFPLGLFRAWAYADLGMRCLVYPRPANTALPLPAGGSQQQQGGRRGSGDDDFAGLRAYLAGESPRRVDWKASARTEQLLAKQFDSALGATLWLDWDMTPGADTEARIAQLARWVLDAHAHGLAYGMRLPGRVLEVAQGEAHLQACLEALALFGLPS